MSRDSEDDLTLGKANTVRGTELNVLLRINRQREDFREI